MNEFPNGSVWEHTESGKYYIVMENGKMLSDSHWIHAVSYQLYGTNETLYTRSQESFREKFTRVS